MKGAPVPEQTPAVARGNVTLPRAALERIPGVLGVVSLDGTIAWLAARWARRLVVDSHAVHSLLELVDLVDVPRLVAWLASGGGEGLAALTITLRAPVGLGACHAQLEAIPDDGGLLVVAYDVSLHHGRAGVEAESDATREAERVAALAAAEAIFGRLIDAAYQGVAICQGGIVRHANAGFVRLFDRGQQGVLGARLLDLVAPEQRDEVERGVAEAPATPFAITGLRPDGGRIELEMCVVPCAYESEPEARAIAVRDVTAQRRANAALRASEERFAAFMEHLPGLAFIKRRDGRFVYVNEGWRRAFPSRGPEFGTGYDFVSLQEAERLRDDDGAVFEQGKVVEYVHRLRSDDGEHDWLTYKFPLIDDTGAPSLLGGIALDVSEHRQAEEALARSEARFRQLIETLPVAISVHRERHVVYANPALIALVGYPSLDAVIGAPIESFLHPDDVATLDQRVARFAADGSPQTHADQRWQRRDGTYAYVEVESHLCIFEGEPAVVSAARDVTERREMQLRLIQAERLAAVGALAAGVAHEVNNPLAYVLLNLDAARGDLRRLGESVDAHSPLAARVASLSTKLALAREGADQVRVIVRDLRTFSRTDDEKRVPTDVVGVIDASINVAWSEIRRRGRLRRDYSEVPPVLANESRLGQVFLNLLVNAAQALPENAAEAHEICVSVRSDAARNVVLVEIKDNGEGIPPDVVGRIFDPFFTTKPAGIGTGLGLSICHGIVASFGGRITVTSRVGHGTTFHVELPIAPHE